MMEGTIEMQVKTLTVADEPQIAAVIRDAFSAPPWCEDWSDEVRLLQYVHEGMDGAGALAFGLDDGQQLVAVVMGHVRHWHNRVEYIIEDVAVRREHQGRGLGKLLMTQTLAACRTLGIDEAGLRTRRDAAAYAFYRKLGFQEQEKDVYFSLQL